MQVEGAGRRASDVILNAQRDVVIAYVCHRSFLTFHGTLGSQHSVLISKF